MLPVPAPKVLSHVLGTPLRALQQPSSPIISPTTSTGCRPRSYVAPVHCPCPLSPAFKRSPQPCKKTRTTTLYLPDILTSSLSLSVVQELDACAPRTRWSAAVPDHLPRRCLHEAAEKDLRHCPAPSPLLPATTGEPLDHRHSPRACSLSRPRRAGEDTSWPPDRLLIQRPGMTHTPARDRDPFVSWNFFPSARPGRANGPAWLGLPAQDSSSPITFF
jgi:hypothetical protein